MSAGGCGWIAVVEIARAGAVCCMIRGRGAELIALWKRACACGGIADSGGNRLFRDVSAEGRKQVSGAGIAERRMPPISTTSSSLRTARLHSSMRCARRRGTVSPPRRFWGGRLRNRLRMRRRPTDTCRGVRWWMFFVRTNDSGDCGYECTRLSFPAVPTGFCRAELCGVEECGPQRASGEDGLNGGCKGYSEAAAVPLSSSRSSPRAKAPARSMI